MSPIYYTLMISEGSDPDSTNSCEREYILVHKIKMNLSVHMHLFCLRELNCIFKGRLRICFTNQIPNKWTKDKTLPRKKVNIVQANWSKPYDLAYSIPPLKPTSLKVFWK